MILNGMTISHFILGMCFLENSFWIFQQLENISPSSKIDPWIRRALRLRYRLGSQSDKDARVETRKSRSWNTNCGEICLFPEVGSSKNTQDFSKTHSLHQPFIFVPFDHWILKSFILLEHLTRFTGTVSLKRKELPLAEVFRRFEEASKGELEGLVKLGYIRLEHVGTTYETSIFLNPTKIPLRNLTFRIVCWFWGWKFGFAAPFGNFGVGEVWRFTINSPSFEWWSRGAAEMMWNDPPRLPSDSRKPPWMTYKSKQILDSLIEYQ